MTTPLQAFALRISERASYAELRVQRAFGEDWITAYGEAWRVMDEVYDLVLAPERPAVYLPARTISRANAGSPI